MQSIVQINYDGIDEDIEYEDAIEKVLNECFKEEKLNSKNIYVNIILTTPQNIKSINKQYRNIDK